MNLFDVEYLKAGINQGGGHLPKNRFFVGIDLGANSLISNLVPAAPYPGATMMESLNLLADSVQIPGRSITTVEGMTTNNIRAYPANHGKEDLPITFFLLNDYLVRHLFDTWMMLMVNQENHIVQYKDRICGNIFVLQYNKIGIPVYGVELRNAFPTNMISIDLANSAEGDLQRMSVNFVYDKMIPLTGGQLMQYPHAPPIVPSTGGPYPYIPNIPGVSSTVIGQINQSLQGPLGSIVGTLAALGIDYASNYFNSALSGSVNSLVNQTLNNFDIPGGYAVNSLITNQLTNAVFNLVENAGDTESVFIGPGAEDSTERVLVP